MICYNISFYICRYMFIGYNNYYKIIKNNNNSILHNVLLRYLLR